MILSIGSLRRPVAPSMAVFAVLVLTLAGWTFWTPPAAAAGGPLAIVRTGDMIEVDVPNRRIHLDLPDEEIAARLADWTPPEMPVANGGYTRLYHDAVEGADPGADFGFRTGCRGNEVPRDSH